MRAAHGLPGAPPPELALLWDCERYNCLPDSGGLLNQDYQTMHRMSAYGNIYKTICKLDNAKGKQIHQLTNQERGVIKWIMDKGLLNG